MSSSPNKPRTNSKKRKFKITLHNAVSVKRQKTASDLELERTASTKQPKQKNKIASSKHKQQSNQPQSVEDAPCYETVIDTQCQMVLPNDVEIVLHKLRDEFPANILNPFPLLQNTEHVIYAIPVIALTQIYSLLHDRTFVDEHIDKMKRENKIRHFQVQIERTRRKKAIKGLHTANGNIAQNGNPHSQSSREYYDNGIVDLYVYTDEYELYIARNLQSTFMAETACNEESKRENAFCAGILDKFVSKLMPNYCHHTISKQQLLEYLRIDDEEKKQENNQESKQCERKLAERVIGVLMNCGLIIQYRTENMYSFTYPKANKITRSLQCGRKEIVSFIWKKQYHRTLKKEILMHKMKDSCLDSLFHFRDLLGANIIKQSECATGMLIELS